MWGAAQRLIGYEDAGQDTVILHFGDHDPSGIDMTRDIADRLELFGARTDVRRIALNMPQIDEHSPPPNPAKATDSRFHEYQRQHGSESWELDALEPQLLADLVREHVADLIDAPQWERDTERMEAQRTDLTSVSSRWPEVAKFLRNGAA
jgi:hypothetical protein